MKGDFLSPTLIGAILVSASAHAPPIVDAVTSLSDMRSGVRLSAEQVHEYLWRQYEIELPKEPPKEEKPKEEEKPKDEPAPAPIIPKAQAKAEPAPQKAEPPPAAAEAGRTLTAPPDAPADFTDPGLVQGDGVYRGGVTARDGKAKTAVDDTNARGGVEPGGSGKPQPPPPPQPEGPDLSAPAKQRNNDWRCPFPEEADAEAQNSAVVQIIVTVNPSGSPVQVRVLSDPGFGFGRAARTCALRERYTPSLDRTGQPIQGQTTPINVRFSR